MMDLGEIAPDLAFVEGTGRVIHLSEWAPRPVVLIFLRHLA
jgi:peroxiredoxin